MNQPGFNGMPAKGSEGCSIVFGFFSLPKSKKMQIMDLLTAPIDLNRQVLFFGW